MERVYRQLTLVHIRLQQIDCIIGSWASFSHWYTGHIGIGGPIASNSFSPLKLPSKTRPLWRWTGMEGWVWEATLGRKPRDMGPGVRSIGLLQWLSGKESPCNAGNTGDMGSIPGLEISPGGGHGNPLQYSYLENPMDRGTGGLQSNAQRVRHDWSNWAHTCGTYRGLTEQTWEPRRKKSHVWNQFCARCYHTVCHNNDICHSFHSQLNLR